MATPAELEAAHFISTVAGLKKKSRALPAQHKTRSSLKDRPRTGLTATSGLIDDKGAADGPSADATSSYAARRQPIIPRPHPAGSSAWSLKLQPNGSFVPSDLARRLQAARLAQRMSLEELSSALLDAPPRPLVLRADQLAAYEDGAAHPSRPALEQLAAVLEEPGLLKQISPAPRKQVRLDPNAAPPTALDRTNSGLDDAKVAELEVKLLEQQKLVNECEQLVWDPAANKWAVPVDGAGDFLTCRRRGILSRCVSPGVMLSEASVAALKERAQQQIDEYEEVLRQTSVREMAKQLHKMSEAGPMTTLLAGRNRIGDAGATLLAAELLPSITFLDLSHNRFRVPGLKALCEAASKPGSAISTLRLSGNRAAFAIAAAAKSSAKEKEKQQAAADGVAASASEGALAINLLLSKSTALRELKLAYCGLTAATLSTILQGSGDDAAAGDGSAKATSSVTELDLGSNPLGAEGSALLAAALQQAPSAASSSPSPSLAAAVRGILANVRSLDVSSVDMGDDGAAAFGSALRDGCALTVVRMDRNAITQNGAAAMCVRPSVIARQRLACSIQYAVCLSAVCLPTVVR